MLRIPECGGAANAQQDFVALRRVEHFLEAVLNRSYEVFDRCLAVGGAQQLGSGVGDGLNLFCAYLGRSRTESTVGGQKVLWNFDVRAHRAPLVAID